MSMPELLKLRLSRNKTIKINESCLKIAIDW